MFLSEPQASSYDWRFQLFGFPVRVTWMFWAFSAAFGYSQARALHDLFTAMDMQSNFAILLLIWVLCSFVSILVHELGHALAFRYFGIDAEIVLYQMGGVAIPGAGLLWSRQGTRSRLTHGNRLVISSAGPAIQIALGVLVGAIAIGCGIPVWMFSNIADRIGVEWVRLPLPANAYLYCAINFLVSCSIWWALFNLLPVYPLDGGQIARHVIGIVTRRDGLYEACMLGVVVGAAVAIWFYQSGGGPIGTLFFASLAYSNWQMLQQGRGGSVW
ncbi:site-2 protease family protein [Pirellulaceae bacterium SH501]